MACRWRFRRRGWFGRTPSSTTSETDAISAARRPGDLRRWTVFRGLPPIGRRPRLLRVCGGAAGEKGQRHDAMGQQIFTNSMAESQRRPLALTKCPLDERTGLKWCASRDTVPVSSQGTLRQSQRPAWLSAMQLVTIPWADRIMRCLSHPSSACKSFYAERPRAPKTLLDWARKAACKSKLAPDRHH